MSLPKTATTQARLPTVPCTNCGGPVRQTRPSKSGLHFCRRPECVRVKAREQYKLREKRQAEIAAEEREEEFQSILALLKAAVHDPRMRCPLCGLVDAIRFFPHREKHGMPCYGLGSSRRGITADHIDAIWPSPSYGEEAGTLVPDAPSST